MLRSKDGVTTTATHVVCSQHPIFQEDPFVLGPLDQLGGFATPISAVWLYESSSADLAPLERLRSAISRLLDYYPHLTGRLSIEDVTGVRSINRIGTGMHLIEASCETSFQSFAVHTAPTHQFDIHEFPRFGNTLLSPWDMSREGAQERPLFTIQRTEFACSSVAIGARISHVVTGAGGFLRLYQDLAEIYRAMDPSSVDPSVELSSPPHLSPFMIAEMLHMNAGEREQALLEQPAGYSSRYSEPTDTPTTRDETEPQEESEKDLDPIVGRTLRIRPAAIVALKRMAVNPDGVSSRVSTFTALTAHLWQRVHLARLEHARNSNQISPVYSRSMYGTSVDFARHFGLPKRSFGNNFVSSILQLDSAKLERASLWEMVEIINGQVRHVSLDETRKLGKWVAAQPQKSLIQLDIEVTPTSFITVGWHVFPLYSGAELDVPPSFASAVPMEGMFDGSVVFTEPKVKDGGVDALVSLRASTWALLDADGEYIMNWHGKE